MSTRPLRESIARQRAYTHNAARADAAHTRHHTTGQQAHITQTHGQETMKEETASNSGSHGGGGGATSTPHTLRKTRPHGTVPGLQRPTNHAHYSAQGTDYNANKELIMHTPSPARTEYNAHNTEHNPRNAPRKHATPRNAITNHEPRRTTTTTRKPQGKATTHGLAIEPTLSQSLRKDYSAQATDCNANNEPEHTPNPARTENSAKNTEYSAHSAMRRHTTPQHTTTNYGRPPRSNTQKQPQNPTPEGVTMEAAGGCKPPTTWGGSQMHKSKQQNKRWPTSGPGGHATRAS